ncbi:hypothetical protein BDW22DRAFT_1345703 [Trametopsis cervina]|nr:hypothetical protein BDW22DRAFT_1345703 [Trametopsis cervina]
MSNNASNKVAAAAAKAKLYKDIPSLPAPQSFEDRGKVLPTLPPAEDTPSNYIPGLYTLGSTYNVLNGKYADSKSCLQQIIDWSQTETRIQSFGGKDYSLPEIVNYNINTTSDYRSSYGKTVEEYTRSLSIHAGFDASFPGFSASASADYSETQRENLSHSFTRIAYAVTHYNLSLPPVSQIRNTLKSWFQNDVDTMDPIEFFNEYGTHFLRSLTIGGRALFLSATDSRTYSSSYSIEAAAKISASYSVASGGIELSTEQKEAMDSFNESSSNTIVTKGGDPRYGNENFLQNVEAWAASIVEYPEFVDFGSDPCFTGLWELASTAERTQTLKNAFPQFIKLYAKDLELPGPYLEARLTSTFDYNQNAYISVSHNTGHVTLMYPPARSDSWYMISSGLGGTEAVLAKELVPGALSPVGWEEAYLGPYYSDKVTRVWRAVPPTDQYLALGTVAMTGDSGYSLPSQPPDWLAGRFRAVHKRALTTATVGVTGHYDSNPPDEIYWVDYRYWNADTELPRDQDCFVLSDSMTVKDWSGW